MRSHRTFYYSWKIWCWSSPNPSLPLNRCNYLVFFGNSVKTSKATANYNLLKRKDNMIYVGSMLDGTGTMTSELSRRIGMARADFNVLKRVWSHANVSKSSKIKLSMFVCWVNSFTACTSVRWRQPDDGVWMVLKHGAYATSWVPCPRTWAKPQTQQC